MWLLPGSLPQWELLLFLKVFCYSCDFYLDSCLSKNSFFTWKCSAIPVTSACIPKSVQPLMLLLTIFLQGVLPFVWFLPGPLLQQLLFSYLKVFCHSCDFYLVACLCKNSFFVEKCGVIHVSSTWMRSCLVVRASDLQCTSCNGPGFDPSIRRHSGIWGAVDEAVLNIVRNKKTTWIPDWEIEWTPVLFHPASPAPHNPCTLGVPPTKNSRIQDLQTLDE